MRCSPISDGWCKVANSCIAIALSVWLVGCSRSSFTHSPATLVVSYWGADVVVLVADGKLSGELPGWNCAESDGEPHRKVCDVRVTSPENARSALGQWVSGAGACYAILPISLDSGGKESDGAAHGRLFQDISLVADSRARVVGGRYLVVIVPPKNLQSVRSEINSMGLSDDTRGYLDALAESMSSLSKALRKE